MHNGSCARCANLRIPLLCLGIAVAAACGPRRVVTAPQPGVACEGVMAWHWVEGARQRRVLDRWCDSVGRPVVSANTENSDIQKGGITQLLVLSWNSHVGAGRVKALVDDIRAKAEQSAGGPVGVVLLLQEVFGAGPRVPESIPEDVKVPRAIRPTRYSPDVEGLARDLSMSVAYAPSMRNGKATSIDEREDRGSAILSTEPLSEAMAIELPFGRQRRVAVAATIRPRHSEAAALRVVSGHFDTGPLKVLQARSLRDWLKALPPGAPTILGMDTNAVLGFADPVVRTVASTLPIENCGRGTTLELWLFRVDFIFSNLGPSPMRACETLQDRHGSDHRPLLLTMRY